MRMLTMSLIFTALSMGAAAQAADQPAAPPTATATPATAVDDDERTVCKNVMVIGSHFTQRVCAKNRQWNKAHESSVEELNRNTQRSLQTTSNGGG